MLHLVPTLLCSFSLWWMLFYLLGADPPVVDTLRPIYHFLPPKNWMNDPNGLMYYKPYYHMFYQYNPYAAYWGNMTWGHAISKDLVHWEHLVPALWQDKPYDINGVFSGSATYMTAKLAESLGAEGLQDLPTLPPVVVMYTGITENDREYQNLAFPKNWQEDPKLTDWVKIDANPLIKNPPFGANSTGFRDPTTAFKTPDGKWNMLLGSGIEGVGGTALVYTSDDMSKWTYEKPLCFIPGLPMPATAMWECPDLFFLGPGQGTDRIAVLKFSADPERRDRWFTGRFDANNRTFVPLGFGHSGFVDHGVFYASKSFLDTSDDHAGRRILFGWLPEADKNTTAIARGWQGVQSLPRVMSLAPDNTLRFQPLPELQSLRGSNVNYSDFQLVFTDTSDLDNALFAISGAEGPQYELYLSIQNYTCYSAPEPTKGSFKIFLRQSSGQYERTSLTFLEGVSYQYGMERPATEYKLLEWGSDIGYSLCQHECNVDPYCYTWSYYINPITNVTTTWRCSLRKTLPAFSWPRPGVISGTKSVLTLSASGVPTLNLPMPATEALEFLHIFVDNSVIEVFVNDGKYVLTGRMYPTQPATYVELEALAGCLNIKQFAFWTMTSAWPKPDDADN